MVYHVLELRKTHFYHYSPKVHWGFGSNFGQREVVLVGHSFYLESTCFTRLAQVLRFGRNLSNWPNFRWLHLPLWKYCMPIQTYMTNIRTDWQTEQQEKLWCNCRILENHSRILKKMISRASKTTPY